MNAPAPTCSTCGGVNTNPQATQCRFCGQALAPHAYGAAQGYGGAPQRYGAPQTYGAPPQPYGGAAGGYGAPAGYGPPPSAYGFQPPSPYGGPPASPYGGPQPNPYGAPNVPVAGFGGGHPYHHGYVNRSAWASGLSAFFWVRVAVAVIAISITLLGACVSALSH